MESFLRAFDAKLAQRRLREILIEVLRDAVSPRPEVPHSFAPDELLAFAEEVGRRHGVRHSPHHPDLIERTAILMALRDRADEARELLEAGVRRAGRPPDEARFLYLLAHHIHFHRGELSEAKRLLHDALQRTETRRHLKSRALLVLGRAARQTQDFGLAASSYEQVLRSGVIKYRPLANQYLAILRSQQERWDEALVLNRRAHAAMRRADQWLGMQLADSDLAAFHMIRKDYDGARNLLESIAAKNIELLDLNAAGLTYNNLAMACERQGDLEGARQAYVQALRFERTSGRWHVLVTTYRNLGLLLSQTDELEAALGAFDRAIELSREIASGEAEFRCRAAVLETLHRHRTHLNWVSGCVARCTELMESTDRIPPESLREYSSCLGRLMTEGPPASAPPGGGDGGLASSEGKAILDRIVGEAEEGEFRKLLRKRIGNGLKGRIVPPPGDLCDFLMLFAGDYFQFKHYASEFAISPARIKHQLRELCQRGIVQLSGAKKSGRYSLAFHRNDG